MGFDLRSFDDPAFTGDYLQHRIEHEAADAVMHFDRLWRYFRNEMHPATELAGGDSGRAYVQDQEMGLPPRITGRCGPLGLSVAPDLQRKEVVVDNDIAWRIQTQVDFLFGRPINIVSRAADPHRARQIETILSAMLEANGGLSFFQELALLGGIYGFVDIVLRTPADWRVPPIQNGRPDASGAGSNAIETRAVAAARSLILETIEAARVLPVLDPDNYRRTRYWVQRYFKTVSQLTPAQGLIRRLRADGREGSQLRQVEVIEVLSPHWWQRYEDRELVAEGANPLGQTPVAHIQNIAQPGSYEGLSDVESLIPLQDELNVRLSDRANRVTYQSFKMYLGKGIEDFLERPVGPGQMWATHNLNASIEEFGHDAGSPSEDAHIEQIRQSLDKVSGVTPLAAGLVRGQVGNLTSATALRVLLSGLINRTQRKRLTYAAGIRQIARLALALLDAAGVFRTTPADREIDIHWPEMVEPEQAQQIQTARAKVELGVPAETVLAEMGYRPGDAPDDRTAEHTTEPTRSDS